MDKDAISRTDFLNGKKPIRPNDCIIKVYRDGKENGICLFADYISKQEALDKFEKEKAIYSKDKQAIVLELILGGISIATWSNKT